MRKSIEVNWERKIISLLVVMALALGAFTINPTVADADSDRSYKGFEYKIKGKKAKYGKGIYITDYEGKN